MRQTTQSITQNIAAAHMPVIRVYDPIGNAIETHDDKGDFKEP
jgi:hypothetical protein